jgi:hypothetical protein
MKNDKVKFLIAFDNGVHYVKKSISKKKVGKTILILKKIWFLNLIDHLIFLMDELGILTRKKRFVTTDRHE